MMFSYSTALLLFFTSLAVIQCFRREFKTLGGDNVDLKITDNDLIKNLRSNSNGDFSADWKVSDRDRLSQDLSEIVKNRSLSGVGPVGARRRWFYSILHQLFVYISEGRNKQYTGTEEVRHVLVSDLVLSHPIDEYGARLTTIQRAKKASKWLRKVKHVCKASSNTSADKVVIKLPHEDISKVLKIDSSIQIWGFDLGKVLVMDGNGRVAALKWAVNHPFFLTEDKKCISFSVPVAISKPEGRAKSLVTLLVRQLYACSDQGCYMEKLNGVFRNMLPENAAAELELIAELLDTSAYPKSYKIKNAYGAASECHIDSAKCKWIPFMLLMKTRYKDFSMFYSQVVQQTNNRTIKGPPAAYAIDCAQRDQGACMKDGWYDPDGYDSDSGSDSDWSDRSD